MRDYEVYIGSGGCYSLQAKTYHMSEYFVTFVDGGDFPIASFRTGDVHRVAEKEKVTSKDNDANIKSSDFR